MYNQLYNYFVSRRLLSDSLAGLKGHSRCTAVLKITEYWREALDERQTVSAVSIYKYKILKNDMTSFSIFGRNLRQVVESCLLVIQYAGTEYDRFGGIISWLIIRDFSTYTEVRSKLM